MGTGNFIFIIATLLYALSLPRSLTAWPYFCSFVIS